jgi:hypothetical protein
MARRNEPLWAWARVRGDANLGVRRGAWYRVIRFTSENALLAVSEKQVRLARRNLDATYTRPLQWSIVHRPADAKNLPAEWGERYAVCPVCCARAQLKDHPAEQRCPDCKGVFELAWS